MLTGQRLCGDRVYQSGEGELSVLSVQFCCVSKTAFNIVSLLKSKYFLFFEKVSKHGDDHRILLDGTMG